MPSVGAVVASVKGTVDTCTELEDILSVGLSVVVPSEMIV